jgi:hypothetical protein
MSLLKDRLWAAIDPVVLTATHTPKGAAFPTVFYWRDASGRAGHDSYAKLAHSIKTDGRCVVIESDSDIVPVDVDERGRLYMQSGEDAILALPRR